MALTFGLVVIGWVFFRADTITEAFDYLTHMADPSLFSWPLVFKIKELMLPIFVAVAVLIGFEWTNRTAQYGFQVARFPMIIRWLLYLVLCFYMLRFQGESSDFIYFQF